MTDVTIFEGPDGAGKTTAIDALTRRGAERRLGCLVAHHGPYEGYSPASLAETYLASLEADGTIDHVLLDRSWLSEPIYGRVFRGGADRVGVARRRMLERVALRRAAVVVNCRPRRDRVVAAYVARGAGCDPFKMTLEQVDRLIEGYATLEATTSLPVVEYDYDQMTVDDLVVAIDRARPPVGGPGIGRWAPGEVALMVGDRLNEDAGRYPFVAWTGCSPWLAEHLESYQVDERSLYWVNATNRCGDPLDAAFVDFLRPVAAVALGARARAWCDRIKWLCPIIEVAHPQFWKRFKTGFEYSLGTALKNTFRLAKERTDA